MSEKIKKIIEYFKDDIDYLEEELIYPNFKGRYITIRDKEYEYLRKLLDYITTLQEENKELNDDNIWWSNRFKAVERDNRDYKSRIDKAIEYIKFTINHYKEQLKTPIEDTYFDTDINRKGYILSIVAYLQTTLDVLQGSDKE